MSDRRARVRTVALAAAILAGLAAAWMVDGQIRAAERRDGARVPVLYAAAPLKRGVKLDLSALDAAVERRMVPASFAPSAAVAGPDELAGLSPLVDVAAGTPLTTELFTATGPGGGFRLRRGERAVTIGAVVSPDGAEAAPGGAVDVYAAGVGGGSRVAGIVLGAEVLAIGDPGDAGAAGIDDADDVPTDAEGGSGSASRAGSRRVTLRVSEAQTARLIRADAFARDLRVVARP